jgi:hypothetical protein
VYGGYEHKILRKYKRRDCFGDVGMDGWTGGWMTVALKEVGVLGQHSA